MLYFSQGGTIFCPCSNLKNRKQKNIHIKHLKFLLYFINKSILNSLKMNKEEEEEIWNEDVDQAAFASNEEYSLQLIAKNFSKQDYIMEPSIFLQLKR